MAGLLADYEQHLAPWAARGATSLGRAYKEEEHEYRSPYQRDRDRIVHSTAFRRLESKTQVYTNLYQQGDHFRKRLTHSLEVAQIARSVARALRLNEDLTEAIALAHDIGHSPFGHKGEVILNNLMKEHGGFDHNTQALRILCVIEHRYPEYQGLNLTYEVREGIAAKGKGQKEPLKEEFKKFPNATLEGQVVDLADPITYSTHDLDDGITAGTITPAMLKDCEFWQEGEEAVLLDKPELKNQDKILKYQVIRYIINEQVTDLYHQTEKNLKEAAPASVEDIRNSKRKLAGFSPDMARKHKDLKMFLRKNMYDHPNVKRMEYKARKVLEELFNAFLDDPDLLPGSIRKHYDREKQARNAERIVCDYLAGMTDRFALEEYNELFSPGIAARR